jgi:transcriptional regulator with XRE-family HTH domain
MRLSQSVFGETLGIKGSSISALERGISNPSNSVLELIEIKYRINREWLLTGKGEKYINEEGANLEDSTYIYKERDDPEIIEVLALTREILKSGTGYSDSLAANIRSFYSAVKTERRLNKMEDEMGALKNQVSGLAERTERRLAEKDDKIRHYDPPEKKKELLEMRVC